MLKQFFFSGKTSAVVTNAAYASSPALARTFSNVRDTRGAFSEREQAIEEQYIRQHDAEVAKKLKEEITQKAASSTPETPAPETPSPEGTVKYDSDGKIIMTPIDSTEGGSVRGGGGAFSKREAAAEERYFQQKNKEAAKHLKDELGKKQ